MCRMYISRDVLFDEFVFPFASLHSTAGARYHSNILLSPAIGPGDDSFSNTTNVHTLPVFAYCYLFPGSTGVTNSRKWREFSS
jgi:hypothetical protein